MIVGGGIIGCSVAYHLTRLGWRDVVLLEQGSLPGHPEGVDAAFVAGAPFEIDIAGDRLTARGSLRAPYDPDALRVKA